MSLGVLNNLSAVYAENNLNNSNNSLTKTLQQLSSGSRINSGADDAAGLSLVDGLQANQQALNQSETNATEGVGLLQVADGALSQVTSLLNRAVTLATEVSNGTLNSSQGAAANQEYQSILSEISNIGSTTTYNQNQVFNSNTSIYTGDSTQAGASVDDLNIRSLSSANLGDTSGAMSYSSGSNGSNVFVNLSLDAATGAQTTAAAIGDTLNAGGTTTLVVNTMSSTGSVVANSITVGGTSGYTNTAQGLISAINNSGLGLTASFTTAAIAGATVSGTSAASDLASEITNTGIMINGAVGVGANPTTSSFSGSATAIGAANTDDLTGSVTFQVGNSASTTLTMAQVAAATQVATGAVTLDDLKTYINNDAALGVTAGDSTSGTLTLQSSSSSNAALKVTSNLVDTSISTGSAPLSYTANAAYSDGLTTGTFATTGVTDSTAVQTADAAISQGIQSTGGGIATIGYSDKAGVSLGTTDLSTQSDAEAALTDINAAITDVAAQDGYIGAQINTLSAVSSVLSTQEENVQSAQNAVQATDYAQASSDMSKYEILSQTGISALAQANSMQQEVTKLLQ